MALVLQFGDWADYLVAGGATPEEKAVIDAGLVGSSPSSPNGPTYPGSPVKPVGVSMPWASLITGMMGQGAGTTNAFTDATARLTQQQAEKQSTYRTFAIVGGVVVVGGFLAYAFMKR